MNYLVLPFIILIIAYLQSCSALQKLIDFEKTNYCENWIADGKPDARGKYSLAFIRVSYLWLFKTPDWAVTDPIARKMFKKVRWTGLVWNCVWVVWLLLLLSFA